MAFFKYPSCPSSFRPSRQRDHTAEDDMMKVRNLGKKSLEEVIQKLEELGLGLKPSEE